MPGDELTGQRPDGLFSRVPCACGRHNVACGPWFPARPGELHAFEHLLALGRRPPRHRRRHPERAEAAGPVKARRFRTAF